MSPEQRHYDRRSHMERRTHEDDAGMEDRLYNVILDRLDNLEGNNPKTTGNPHEGNQLTFTIPQILATLFAIVTASGSILAAWVNINNQITSQKVSTDLSIAQLQKDVDTQLNVNKDLHARMDSHVSNVQNSLDKITNRVDELDNTVNQLYNRFNQKK